MASQASLTTRRLRSGDDNVYLIGKCEPKIVGVKLPSNKQVLQLFCIIHAIKIKQLMKVHAKW